MDVAATHVAAMHPQGGGVLVVLEGASAPQTLQVWGPVPNRDPDRASDSLKLQPHALQPLTWRVPYLSQ